MKIIGIFLLLFTTSSTFGSDDEVAGFFEGKTKLAKLTSYYFLSSKRKDKIKKCRNKLLSSFDHQAQIASGYKIYDVAFLPHEHGKQSLIWEATALYEEVNDEGGMSAFPEVTVICGEPQKGG